MRNHAFTEIYMSVKYILYDVFGTSCKQFKKYATYDYYLKLVTDYS